MTPASDPVLARFRKTLTNFRGKIKTVYFYGSRAKGTHRPDSDYDILLVVGKSFSQEDKNKIYDRVMDILLETGRLVSLKIFKESSFKNLCRMRTPFMNHILREGVLLG